MKFTTDDGRFEGELFGSKAKIKINLGSFQGEFKVEELPPKLDEFRQVLAKIAEQVELFSGMVKRDLRGDSES